MNFCSSDFFSSNFLSDFVRVAKRWLKKGPKKNRIEKKRLRINGLGFFSTWTGLKFVKFLKKKNIVRISEKIGSEKQ
jgi:hypothetical protein